MSYKISRLEIYNCLGIQEYQLDPKHINVVSGGNGKGKTTLLDSIFKGIYNESTRPVMVRNGQDQAMIIVKLQDENGQEISVERTINAADSGKDKVNVLKDGISQKKPETFLKSLVGQYAFGFNPVSFIQMKDKDQTDILLSLLPIMVTKEMLQSWFKDETLYPEGYVPPVNTNLHGLEVCKELANDKGGFWYEKRKVANKEVEDLSNEAEAISAQLPDNFNSAEWENISLMDKSTAIQEAMKINGYIDEAQKIVDTEEEDVNNLKAKNVNEITNNDERFDFEIDKIQTEIQALEIKIAELKIKKDTFEDQKKREAGIVKNSYLLQIDQRKQRSVNAQKYIDNTPKIDIEPLNEDFAHTERMRSFIPLAEKRGELSRRLLNKQYEASVYDRFVTIARSKPKELLESVSLPVEGLGINDNGNITIHGLPIKNLSTSEQIRVALDIARETCGEMKMISIDRFESLDPEVQKMFFEQIENDGYQYFVTDISREYDEDGNYLSALKVDTKE